MEQVRLLITAFLCVFWLFVRDMKKSPFLSGSEYASSFKRASLTCWLLGHWWFHMKTEQGYYSRHKTYFCPVCGAKYLYHC
ncbi:hypothetical protein DIRTYBETTY_64 [Bacillus phage DirtyBetty]|uniref:Uncharacterized protein n=2 Tax=Wphvirus megatron TaxID=1987728 RepID=A0A1B1PBJ6_9CAUD|nr:hypothetical protein QLX47_gp066 [Bacillus phage Eyuki]YP_009285006.1 hypothetical protein BIZ88_gp064 [Bacillus phage DirtyBetty]ALA46757.1 hypothetical protein EYUKI_66 [Bacillus phage Eyuki]ANT41536.1 hypothetical protein DIRTYBETTY_64 [Bacillus phage DirtyBetty]ASR79388.1 hypothetical protein ZAINNY_64 [Bacillus phage Zainny]